MIGAACALSSPPFWVPVASALASACIDGAEHYQWTASFTPRLPPYTREVGGAVVRGQLSIWSHRDSSPSRFLTPRRR